MYILVIDAGTTGIRSIIFDKKTTIVSQAYAEIPQIYPESGWTEQDPEIIWEKCVHVVKESLEKKKLGATHITAIGITNQRSTSLLWDKTGTPLYNAITWQDTRAYNLCKAKDKTIKMRSLRTIGRVIKGVSHIIPGLRRLKAGKLLITVATLSFNPGTSLAHLGWVLTNVEGAQKRAENNELLAGTIDTWLVWKLTGGKTHATDFSNASATSMFDTFKLQWSDLFLDLFNIPKCILPEVKKTSDTYGETAAELFGSPIPITGVVADQQAALFAETCFTPGDVKCTHGTGTFIDMNVGHEPVASFHKLVPLIGWNLNGKVTYMLEGYLNTTGCAIQWLCDGLIAATPADTEAMATTVADTGGVYVVPAFQGLTSPYWDPLARGIVIGLTRSTTKEHVVRALLEAIAYRCKDVMMAMEEDAGIKITQVKADGNASQNNFLLQFMADILDVEIERPHLLEATAVGAAYFAGLHVGYWTSQKDIETSRNVDKRFCPKMTDAERELRYKKWKNAVERSFNWA